MRHVHADLVCAAGLQHALNVRATREMLNDAKVRARRFAVVDHRHLYALVGMTADGRIDETDLVRLAQYQRGVMALHRMFLQLAHQIGLRSERARHDHQA